MSPLRWTGRALATDSAPVRPAGDVARVDGTGNQAHAQIGGWCTDLDLEGDQITSIDQPPQHLERVGFRNDVEAHLATGGDLIENVPAAERAVG